MVFGSEAGGSRSTVLHGTREEITYCRICEALCGLVATVEDGKLVAVRGDRENPYSKGFLCTKASGMIEVTYDPDRVLQPLRRSGGAGEFEQVSWDQAMEDISARLTGVIERHGPRSVAAFIGNPPFFNHSAPLALDGLLKAIGSPWKYSINGEDAASHIASQAILYGSAALLTKPDFWRTDFALIFGANPIVSKGSFFNEPLIRQALQSIVERGGRVVVVDPRRSETARQFEHIPVRAGTDPWLLLGILSVLMHENLFDGAFVSRHTSGLDRFVELLEPFTAEGCSTRCGVPEESIVALARSFAGAPTAVVYGRTGTCTQRFGTLNNILQELLMVVTGNIERPGGGVFGWGPVDFADFARRAGLDTYGKYRTRVRGLPDALGLLPAQGLVDDIITQGPDQIRALLVLGGNPVVTTGVARALPDALEQLELCVSLDLYVNDTNKHADYVLPVPGFFEREDIPFFFSANMLRPSMFVTGPVIPRQGAARGEAEILDEIAHRMRLGGAHSLAPLRWLARVGINLKAKLLIDLILRTSRVGDWFGLRPTGLSWRKLGRRHPHGVLLKEDLPREALEKRLRTPDKKIPLAPVAMEQELIRLRDHADDPEYPLRVIGRREVRSHNSWMHNVLRLVPEGRLQSALIHPQDAIEYGVHDGQVVNISSKAGSIAVVAAVSDDMTPGTIAVPHGWGHSGGWRHANRAGGANSNLLVSTETADVEVLSGMSILNGIPVRLAPAGDV